MANDIRAGTVWINGDIIGTLDYPWGEYKESGYGKELSISGLDEFIQKKAIALIYPTKNKLSGIFLFQNP